MSGIAQGITLLDHNGLPQDNANAFPLQTFSTIAFGGGPTTVNFGTPLPISEEVAGSQVNASNVGVAAAAVSATLPGVGGKTTYIRGFVVSTTNPAAAVSGLVTVTGLVGGPLNFELVESVAQGGLLPINFGNSGLAASGQNTAIVVNLAAIAGGGAGAVSAWGVQI